MKNILIVFLLSLFAITTSAQHNVLLIIADDLGTDYLGFYEDHQDTAAVPNLRILEEADVEAVRRFLQRRDGLANEPQLAAQLANRIRVRLELQPPENPYAWQQDIDLLRRVVAQYGQ